ncbi:MAG: nucleotide sugar dehydrogenase [Chlorobiaceae bacterium]|nr:nucleotide sugar dehydrogenase [Chlorobiaceae bacterium]
MSEVNIAVIGLGYVGLPLAVEFAKKYPVVGFDIKKERIDELNQGQDLTLEVNQKSLNEVLSTNNPIKHGNEIGLFVTDDSGELVDANVYIVTVPTPTDKHNRPELTPLIKASETVGSVLKPGDLVIYESTVYPGATEDCCVPVLERVSGLEFNRDFFAGYSPERINPGDKSHTVTKIRKVTSGSTQETAVKVDQLYRSIITAGTHMVSSIRVAEAAKVIENSQRDINIAFVNELAMIFNRMGIDTNEVLEAASTKWNFLPFKPGLVGGHCIGVDPYYLAQKAQECGYHPEVILAGRRLNDNMGRYVATEVVKLMIGKEHQIKGSKVLMLGVAFKENCPDIRNSRAVDIAFELMNYGIEVDIFDPWVDTENVRREYRLPCLSELNGTRYDAIVLAVAHDQFQSLKIRELGSCGKAVVYDVKGVLNLEDIDGRL